MRTQPLRLPMMVTHGMYLPCQARTVNAVPGRLRLSTRSYRHLPVAERPRLEIRRHVAATDVRLPKPLDLDDRQAPHELLSRCSRDTQFGTQRLHVEQLGQRTRLVAHRRFTSITYDPPRRRRYAAARHAAEQYT